MMENLKIHKDFKSLIPPLSESEYNQLEQSILAEGCRETVKTWRGYIIDGHNRVAICTYNGIKFKTERLNFANKAQAIIWIAENQLGRRNLTDADKIEIALAKTEILRKQARKNQAAAISGNKVTEPVNIRKTVAEAANLSNGTIHKYMTIKSRGSAELLQKVRKGEMKIGTAYKTIKQNADLAAAQVKRRTVLFNAYDDDFADSPIHLSNMLSSLNYADEYYAFLQTSAGEILAYDLDGEIYPLLCSHLAEAEKSSP